MLHGTIKGERLSKLGEEAFECKWCIAETLHLHPYQRPFGRELPALLVARNILKPGTSNDLPGRHFANAAAKGKAAVVWIQENDASGIIDSTRAVPGSGFINHNWSRFQQPSAITQTHPLPLSQTKWISTL